MSKSIKTTDHDEIRRWVEERGGKPARVKWTVGRKDAGLLRVDFPGSGEDTLEQIDWDTWFEAFDEDDLEFVCQDETSDGRQSRFNKLVPRHRGEKHASPP